MDAREPAALLESSTVKRTEEDLIQLCTTSFMASFIQMKAWQTYSSLFLYKKKKQFRDEVSFICYVNNIISFILIVHNTVYFFTSSKSMRTVLKQSYMCIKQSAKKKNNLKEIIRLEWNI